MSMDKRYAQALRDYQQSGGQVFAEQLLVERVRAGFPPLEKHSFHDTYSIDVDFDWEAEIEVEDDDPDPTWLENIARDFTFLRGRIYEGVILLKEKAPYFDKVHSSVNVRIYALPTGLILLRYDVCRTNDDLKFSQNLFYNERAEDLPRTFSQEVTL